MEFSKLAGKLGLPGWWNELDANSEYEEASFYGLALGYTALAVVALVQLIRIERRVPEYGWTTQKVFHLLNFLVCLLRALVLGFDMQLQTMHEALLKCLLFDLPGLLFFTTYTLLVLFWAEIYHQAKSLPTGKLRPTFMATNVAVYAVQVGLLVFFGLAPSGSRLQEVAMFSSNMFLVLVSIAAAGGFLMYGGRLFVMLRRFPIESRGRKKKLREVGMVTAICTICFTLRAIIVLMSLLDSKDFALDITTHPMLNVLYYTLVEIVPSALVLFILRKLPPKRNPPFHGESTSTGV